jgi:molybdenum cofactor cytidylyltransferase
MTETKQNVGIVILAAGASTRFGQPKQLLEFEEKSLVRRAVGTALESNCFPVIVVLGSNFDLIKSRIRNLDCEIVYNEKWQMGISSSIKKGLSKLLEISPNSSAVIFALCDQPFIQSEHFNKLIKKFYESNKPIIASVYDETTGVPALFSNELFPVLTSLDGDNGAQEIIKNNPESVGEIFLPEAGIDIDTKADFEKFKNFKP